MKLLLASLLLATTCCTTVFAAEFSATSKIDAVTVFPQGADVVRDVAIDVPAGEHSLILADLPQNIDPQSIRVEGTGDGALAIGSVDLRERFQGKDAYGEQRKVLEKELQDLAVERQALDLSIADLNQQRAILASLADKQLVPQSTTETVKTIDVAQLGQLLDLVGQKLSVTSKSILDAQARQRLIDERTTQVSAQLGELPSGEDYRTEVVVNVEAQAAMKGNLRVSYRVQEASWTPFYDARLTLGDGTAKPALELVHRASVTQNTGEVWSNVSLVLSTARPGGSTAAPEMTSWEVSKVEEPEPKYAGDTLTAPAPVAETFVESDQEAAPGAVLRKLDARKQAPIKQKQAVIEIGGFQATYSIAGRVTVDNAGQAKKVRITSHQHEAALQAVAAPRDDAAAYLTASFKVAGEGPQLPGQVNLYRDGIYVGQGVLPLLNPSEEARLGFGVDDLVKVKRSEVNRISGEEGLLTSSNVDQREWDITVKNLHKTPIAIRIVDRVPFTASKEITITERADMTAPTERDLEKRRGVLAWDFTLEPQAENVVKTGYKITWPEGMRVSIVD
jgi:uncharacterized protein (TIGR02231 family)